MNDLLELNGVCKSYPGFALNKVSFSLPRGYIMGLVGPNGAGKTTTIQLILNMFEKDSGKITVNGRDNVEEESAVKQAIGAVFDSSIFVDAWKVQDVEKAVSLFYESWNHDTFMQLIARFELPLDKKVGTFSRGMQMKLMLAASLSHGAELLILDEPTSGLDPVTRDELLEILQDYISNGERSVLFSTHITTDLERIADYITLINRGEIFFTGSTDDLTSRYRLIKGKPSDLTPELEKGVTVLRKTDVGFEGIINAKEATGYQGCVIENATIDNIIIGVSKAGSTVQCTVEG